MRIMSYEGKKNLRFTVLYRVRSLLFSFNRTRGRHASTYVYQPLPMYLLYMCIHKKR